MKYRSGLAVLALLLFAIPQKASSGYCWCDAVDNCSGMSTVHSGGSCNVPSDCGSQPTVGFGDCGDPYRFGNNVQEWICTGAYDCAW